MPSTTTILSTALALGLATAQADVNPNAQGPCNPTKGEGGFCGPNGSEEWLNSGLGDDGWNPPYLDINELSHISLEEYYGGVGSNCAQYDEFFKSSGQKYNIDPAILAFIAMQESSCNADAGGPTPGLMQCAPGNCYEGQGGSCQYPIQDNVDCGAWVLRDYLDSSDGNAVRALGRYNGWFTAADNTGLNGGKGLTEGYPCSGEGQSNGVPQNLDYLHEVLNGWFMGYDMYGSDSNLGGYYNCQGNCYSGPIC
ncbi:extracellular soluble lytic transglycosylase [Emericellopsis atlantica]|uniref:Extracellular soluble lytic transglycosylase n=1 Tax=Emericellopsis atlantica TaxID=2614577 RepID=A0A9P7ZI26_9HYPO|nr:extracellular soluble lytic transglycosylase [Emericellopsis atlantica]KAG9252430.1 extracellular soluble lytic transglycosylase [Emericellopsis atlantica]